MTAPKGFALLTPAQRAAVSAKGGRAAQASGYANRFTRKAAKAAGKRSAELRKGTP